MNPETKSTTRFRVPVEFYIEVDADTRAVSYHLSPLESYAGYFGPASRDEDGDADPETELWPAVQADLAQREELPDFGGTLFPVSWTE